MNLIDNVNKLMELNSDELTEVLLQDKYNKANLRELVRRSLISAKEYKKAFEYEKEQAKKLPLRFLKSALEFSAKEAETFQEDLLESLQNELNK